MEKMKGIYTYTPFLIILMSGLSLSQHYVCLKYKDRGDTIDIICSVDRLRFQITFKNPAGEENGYCGSPYRVGNESVFCNGKFNINQNLTTNTTTLNIKKNEFIYGEWKCNHGTNIGSDSVDIKMPDVKESNPLWERIIPWIIIVILIVPTCFGVRDFVVWIKGKEECVPKCTSCSQDSICAICIDCKKMFCEKCSNTHSSSKPKHKVFITGHASYEVNCEYCSNMATLACLHCCVVFCNNCEREHSKNNHNTKLLIKSNGGAYRRGNMEGTSKLKHARISLINPVRNRQGSPRSQQVDNLLIKQSGSSTDW